jgi:hypothetical protein
MRRVHTEAIDYPSHYVRCSIPVSQTRTKLGSLEELVLKANSTHRLQEQNDN